ncbi:hypothetical protein ACNJ7K_24170 [Rhodococcus aetherivorans]
MNRTDRDAAPDPTHELTVLIHRDGRPVFSAHRTNETGFVSSASTESVPCGTVTQVHGLRDAQGFLGR